MWNIFKISSATSNTAPNASFHGTSHTKPSTAPDAASAVSTPAPKAALTRPAPKADPKASVHGTSHTKSSTAPKAASAVSRPAPKAASFLVMPNTTSSASINTDIDPDELPLSEESYQAIAALKDDNVMLRYVRRELHTLGLRSVSEGELKGWVPYFSGTIATRSREVMLEELRAKAWVNELPLSEQAYQKVAALKDDEAMLRYVRRELDDQGLRSLSESELKGWVPYFSGTRATRSRKVMLDELRSKDWVGALPLSEESYQKMAALKSDEAMLRYVRRELRALGLRSLSESELRGWVPYFSGTKATRSREAMLEELRTKEWVGELPLSEEAYQKVAELKDDEAMLRYVRREMDAQALRSGSESELRGWVPYFSGTKATRTRKEMLRELHSKEWVVHPELSEEGYQKVASLKNDEAMLRYIRRELDALGRRAKSEGALKGFVSYYSGTKATRSRAIMLDELRSADWLISNAKGGSYAERKKAI